jgi:hypothetical protein
MVTVTVLSVDHVNLYRELWSEVIHVRTSIDLSAYHDGVQILLTILGFPVNVLMYTHITVAYYPRLPLIFCVLVELWEVTGFELVSDSRGSTNITFRCRDYLVCSLLLPLCMKCATLDCKCANYVCKSENVKTACLSLRNSSKHCLIFLSCIEGNLKYHCHVFHVHHVFLWWCRSIWLHEEIQNCRYSYFCYTISLTVYISNLVMVPVLLMLLYRLTAMLYHHSSTPNLHQTIRVSSVSR